MSFLNKFVSLFVYNLRYKYLATSDVNVIIILKNKSFRGKSCFSSTNIYLSVESIEDNISVLLTYR